jgi:SanA protein
VGEGGANGGRGRRGRWRRRAVASVATVALLLLAMHMHVLAAGAWHGHAAGDVPAADAIVVPGARIHADGRPFDLLADRLATAHELFAAGKAPRLVLSGRGGGGIGVDEVAAMRRWLAARGVPAAAMVDDGDGLRTLDTMRNCRDALRLRSVIVVSNPFHVDRAVFLARSAGLDARGVAAPYRFEYSAGTMWKNRSREALARVRAWLDVFVFGATALR